MFTNGLQSISRMTTKEYRILMKVMVFVVDNLYKENENNVENFVENKKLSEKDTFEWAKLFFGIINGYTTETYESLHKDFVKIPYRMSNKKNVEDQIMKTLKRQDIINVINKKQKKKKPTKLLNFSSKLFETKLTEANIYFCEKMNDPNINDNMIKGFNQFLECFNDFLDNILEFGIINGYTTETYESLHKDFVKIPYRMSNKKNVEDQIMKTLKRQDIINVINKKQKKKKPTKLLNFSSKLFETKLTEANIYFCEKMNDPNINDNMIKGFNQFLECFNDFLDNILEVKNIKECDIIIYGMATLENESIIRAKNKFHDKPWFSNVAISMDSNESSDY
ncbi:hypothetical protein Glove_35g13 [Diversispora epigaea]|uniref:Uncharacterized protein n=1 Tax=Diversispora epigaea TaxID=1348612 RepID=A0A397JGE3_9GLOM|nr:hypothetical protein Glove_35g13 [Diversispora epigaea]